MDPLSWGDCYRAMNALAGRTRLSWPEPNSGGFNCYEGVSISDIWGAFAWIVTAPGDLLLGMPVVARFLELETPVVRHSLSWFIGVARWWGILMVGLSSLNAAIEKQENEAFQQLQRDRERGRQEPEEAFGRSTSYRAEPPLRARARRR